MSELNNDVDKALETNRHGFLIMFIICIPIILIVIGLCYVATTSDNLSSIEVDDSTETSDIGEPDPDSYTWTYIFTVDDHDVWVTFKAPNYTWDINTGIIYIIDDTVGELVVTGTLLTEEEYESYLEGYTDLFLIDEVDSDSLSYTVYALSPEDMMECDYFGNIKGSNVYFMVACMGTYEEADKLFNYLSFEVKED